MKNEEHINSIDTLKDIKRIMEQSTRFLSLSGWSGIWAGSTALLGGVVAYLQIHKYYEAYNFRGAFSSSQFNDLKNQLLLLAFVIVCVALMGAYFFTNRKIKKEGLSIWNQASKKLMINIAIPMIAGGMLILGFLHNNDWRYVAPACLIFYGLALINGSKFTLNDIRYLGILELILGCICIYFPGLGLYFWIVGFGILHIVYGIVMWRKYDSKPEQ
jgi:hypothetical protein